MYVCVYAFVYVDTYIHTHDAHTHTHMHTQVLLATPLPQPGPHAPAAGMAGEPEEGGREWEGSTAGGEGAEVSHMVQHHGGAEVSHGGGDGPLSRMWRDPRTCRRGEVHAGLPSRPGYLLAGGRAGGGGMPASLRVLATSWNVVVPGECGCPGQFFEVYFTDFWK